MRVDPDSRWCLENQCIPVTDMCGSQVTIRFDYDYSKLVNADSQEPQYYSTFAYGINNAVNIRLSTSGTNVFVLPFRIDDTEWQYIQKLGCPALEEKQIPYNICVETVPIDDIPNSNNPDVYYQFETDAEVSVLKITIDDSSIRDDLYVFSNKLLTFKSKAGFLFLDSDIN